MTPVSEGKRQSPLLSPPRWVLGLVAAVVWATSATAVTQGVQLLQGKELQAEQALINGGCGLAVAAFHLWYWRHVDAKAQSLPSGSPTSASLRQAISTGRLPEQASADLWEPELFRALMQARQMAWLGPLAFGLFTVLGIVLIVNDPRHPWFGVYCSVLFLALSIWTPASVRSCRAQIHTLLAQFPEEESLWR